MQSRNGNRAKLLQSSPNFKLLPLCELDGPGVAEAASRERETLRVAFIARGFKRFLICPSRVPPCREYRREVVSKVLCKCSHSLRLSFSSALSALEMFQSRKWRGNRGKEIRNSPTRDRISLGQRSRVITAITALPMRFVRSSNSYFSHIGRKSVNSVILFPRKIRNSRLLRICCSGESARRGEHR